MSDKENVKLDNFVRINDEVRLTEYDDGYVYITKWDSEANSDSERVVLTGEEFAKIANELGYVKKED